MFLSRIEAPKLPYHIPPELLEFLHRAYPSWDVSDTAAHATLVASFPSAAIARRLVDALQAGDLVGTGYAEPQGDRLCQALFMWSRIPSDYLPGGPKGPGPKRPPPPDSPPRVPWAELRISVLGPFAALTWFLNPTLPGEEAGIGLQKVLIDLLQENSVQLLPREVLWCPIARMRGHRVGLRRLAPNVEAALFGHGADIHGRPARG